MGYYWYKIVKAGSNCSGSNFWVIKVGQNEKSDSYFTANSHYVYDFPSKRTWPQCLQFIEDELSPLDTNGPSNQCLTKYDRNQNEDGHPEIILVDGEYQWTTGLVIGDSLDSDLEQYLQKSAPSKPKNRRYFEDFSSRNLVSKRKRKRARQII